MKKVLCCFLLIAATAFSTACEKSLTVNVPGESSASSTTTSVNAASTSVIETSSESKESSKPSSTVTTTSSPSSTFVPVVTTPMTMDELVADMDNWNMVLVNGSHPLPDGFSVGKTKIKSSYLAYSGLTFDSRAISYLEAMCAAAQKSGVNLKAISAYRTNARQTELFNNQIEKQRKKYPNKSEEELKQIASTISARPGTSEHELGLAVDFNSVEESFENTKEGKWLKENAADYGFILRYPKEKQSITGVIYEPWHYRYVGVDHAKKMNSLGLCLEEYIEYLKNYK